MEKSKIEKPRGKMTPFAFYVFICMEEARKKFPDKTLVFQMFEDVCLKRWENMTKFNKRRFLQMSQYDEIRFNEEMREYQEKKNESTRE